MAPWHTSVQGGFNQLGTYANFFTAVTPHTEACATIPGGLRRGRAAPVLHATELVILSAQNIEGVDPLHGEIHIQPLTPTQCPHQTQYDVREVALLSNRGGLNLHE